MCLQSVTKDRNHEIEKDLAKEKEKQRSFGSPIDPLLAVLSSFTTSTDLSDRIRKVFDLLDHEVSIFENKTQSHAISLYENRFYLLLIQIDLPILMY